MPGRGREDRDATVPRRRSLRTDLRNAGAGVADEEVVDRRFTTGRSPAGLPAFCAAIVRRFAGSTQSASS